MTTCRFFILLGVLTSTAFALNSTTSDFCPRDSGPHSLVLTHQGWGPSLQTAGDLEGVTWPWQCARMCVGVLGGRCRALAHSHLSSQCRLFSRRPTLASLLPAPDFLLFQRLPVQKSCSDYLELGETTSNVYILELRDGGEPFDVFCDMTTEPGGWTVFQRRMDGSVNFERNWTEYKEGFGNVFGEYWLGNDNLHRLTASGLTELRVDLMKWNTDTAYQLYQSFSVEDEHAGYRMTYGTFTGTAGNGLGQGQGMLFTTADRDNDNKVGNCAATFKSGWWHNACFHANPNGLYGFQGATGNQYNTWNYWYGPHALKVIELKLR